jgi:UDP-glucose 4-epimerase
MGSNVLVTGGNGFVGSALCARLVELGHYVVSIDNHSNSGEAPEHPDVQYFALDCNQINLLDTFKVKFDYIFHLGEYARVEQSFSDYYRVIDLNYHPFPKVLDFAKRHGSKLIYSGSSTKFAIGEKEGKAMSPYAYTKAQNTELLKCYSDWYGLEYAIVYFYNVYGQYEKAKGKMATVVAKFIDLVKSGEKFLPVTSPGTQLRNFTHIDDIVDGLILAGFKGSGDGYTIGSPEKYSVLDLVEMLGAEPVMMSEKAGNRMNGELNSTKLKGLGWEAKRNLKEYIKESMS